MKFLQKNMGEDLCDLEIGKNCLGHKFHDPQKFLKRLPSSKLKAFDLQMNDTIKQTKTQTIVLEKILRKCTWDKTSI